MSDGDDIAAEVHEGLIEAATDTGQGELTATLIKPGVPTGPEWDPQPGVPTSHIITLVDISDLERDTSGSLTGRVERRLLVSAIGARPEKGDTIQLGTRKHRVVTVSPLEPGGTTLLFEVLIDG